MSGHVVFQHSDVKYVYNVAQCLTEYVLMNLVKNDKLKIQIFKQCDEDSGGLHIN